MAGWLTNGMPPVQAVTQNGVASGIPPGQAASALLQTDAGVYTNLSGAVATIPVDTNLPSGVSPQSVAASVFQVASEAAALINNTATSTVHTATLNTTSGMMVTEALTTAAGATYTFQLVNSLIVSSSTPAPQVQMHDGTNTAGSAAVTSITNAAGTATVVFTNTGTAAWNGTKLIAFHV